MNIDSYIVKEIKSTLKTSCISIISFDIFLLYVGLSAEIAASHFLDSHKYSERGKSHLIKFTFMCLHKLAQRQQTVGNERRKRQ